MKKITSLFKRLPLVRAWKDFKNYLDWIKVIKTEAANPKSIFNKHNMKKNFFYNVYIGVTLPQEDSVLPDNIKRLRVIEALASVHRYLDNELGFAEYIVPEFNQVFDSENNPTLTYIIVYRFQFNILSVKFVIKNLIYLTILYFLITKINWEIVYTWIMSLI